MGFVEDAESIRAKAHLTDIPKPAIAGIALGVLAVVALVVGSAATALGLGGDAGFSIASSDSEAVEQHGGGDAASVAEESEAGSVVVVHVTGAVTSPGVYELADRDRVQDAVDAAGGFVDGADASAVNCARVVQDGEQIVVPTIEATSAPESTGDGGGGSVDAGAGEGSSGKVNINRADAAELDTLPGVGPSTAEKIIADREANGPFASVEDIKRVSGIGDKKYEQLAGLICV